MSPKGKPQGDLVTAAFAARTLGCDVRTMRRWIQRGRIAGTHIAQGEDGRGGSWYVYRWALDLLKAAP